ncbi:MAG: hypothetical protein LBV78_23895, partial [Kitasatospora sp.]|nr:hypothetical protein [Kitasatospora sp.]
MPLPGAAGLWQVILGVCQVSLAAPQPEADLPTSNLPPVMSGHWLMKRGQVSTERTWNNSTVALDWLTKHFLDNPPMEREDGR